MHHFRYFSGSTNHVSFILFTFFLRRVFFLRSFSNSVARADFSLLKIKGPFHDPMEHTEKSSVHGFSESVKRCFATRKRRWLGCIVSFAWPLFYIIQSDGPFPWGFSRLFTTYYVSGPPERLRTFGEDPPPIFRRWPTWTLFYLIADCSHHICLCPTKIFDILAPLFIR